MKESTHIDFIKAQPDNRRQDRNYNRLIEDCTESVKFLNKLPMGLLEESLAVFRENIFSMPDRKTIPTKIYQILEKELEDEQIREVRELAPGLNAGGDSQAFKEMVRNKYDHNLFKIA
jgi:hypothetical protein